MKFLEAGSLTRATKNIHMELMEKERAMAMLIRGHSRPIKRNSRIGRGRTMTDDDLVCYRVLF